MPALNLAAENGDRVGFGTYTNKCSWTYFTNDNSTNTPNASIDLTPTGLQTTGTLLVTNDSSFNGKCVINNDIYVNSSKNSVILNNDGTKFNIKLATSLNGTPQSLVPLSFILTNTKSGYDNSDITGKMTIGGDLHTNGTITASGKVFNAVWNDYAEFFERGEKTEVGDIVALDECSDEERYVKASKENPFVIGVHSDTYGHIIGGSESIEESEKTHIPVGLVGRVKTKIVGGVRKGDFIVLSDIPGVGRKFNPDTDKDRDIIGGVVETNLSEEIKLVKMKIK